MAFYKSLTFYAMHCNESLTDFVLTKKNFFKEKFQPNYQKKKDTGLL